MHADKTYHALPGIPVAAIIVLGVPLAFVLCAAAGLLPLFGSYLLLAAFLLAGLKAVSPNQSYVLRLFGDYAGTIKKPGLWWVNPLLLVTPMSLRVRNFDSSRLKVNDQHGNPIEIGAIVVWRVCDSAEAAFNVDDVEHFLKVQTEGALRALATRYPYDAADDKEVALRSNVDHVAKMLQDEVQQRLERMGVEVMEARISHLAYAPEIAQAMLQRQQASAIIAARQLIVDGAVGMVETALKRLAADNIVQLDEQRKAAMVVNLLLVLCSERAVQPVVDTRSA